MTDLIELLNEKRNSAYRAAEFCIDDENKQIILKVAKEFEELIELAEKEREGCITLCGSTRFYEDFRFAKLQLTLHDFPVYTIGIDTKSGNDLKDAGTTIDHFRLDRLHKRKISRGDSIMVIDVNGYIGSSTSEEIAYAIQHGKKIYSYVWTKMFKRFDRPIEVPACEDCRIVLWGAKAVKNLKGSGYKCFKCGEIGDTQPLDFD